MRDLNFFQDFIQKDQFKIDKSLIYFTISTFIILSFITYSIYNHFIIRQEVRTVASLQAIAENPETLRNVEKIREKEIEVNEFRDSVEKIRKLDETIETRDIINQSLLDNITLKMPDDLFLTSIGINSKDIQLVGMAKGKWAIAEFERGLEDLDNAEEIFISKISLNDDYYDFNINITVEDENIDGEESEEV